MSPRMPAMALPESTASIRASSSACRSMRSPRLTRQRARSLIGTRDQSRKAALAACTARSTSTSVARGTSASLSMVEGLIETKLLPSTGAVHRPPMNNPRGWQWSCGACMATSRHDGGANDAALGRLLEGDADLAEWKLGLDNRLEGKASAVGHDELERLNEMAGVVIVHAAHGHQALD